MNFKFKYSYFELFLILCSAWQRYFVESVFFKSVCVVHKCILSFTRANLAMNTICSGSCKFCLLRNPVVSLLLNLPYNQYPCRLRNPAVNLLLNLPYNRHPRHRITLAILSFTQVGMTSCCFELV
jgi:hypothetical protein